jgi:WD40 repeat protein
MQRATPDHRLTRINTSCLDPNQELTGCRNGTGHVAHFEDVDATIRMALFESQGDFWMFGPYWTPDSRANQYLHVENEVSNIWEQSLTGRPAKQLTHFIAGHIQDFAWSSDRSRLYFTRDTQHSDVVLFTSLH